MAKASFSMQILVPVVFVLLTIAFANIGSAQQQRPAEASDQTNAVNINSKEKVYKLQGPNVCKKNQRIPKQVTVPERVPVSVRKTTWCLQVPPRCENSETVYRMIYNTKMEYTDEMIDTCCSGYHEAAGRCVPFCTQQCHRGQCVAPDTCECEPGFNGPSCSINCPRDKWGTNCTSTCTCLNGAKCDAVDGRCDCTPGWKGDNCSEPCSLHYGHMCMLQCRCLNGAECDHISGECKCQPGFCGPLCERTEPNCPAGETRACEKCQNGGKCRRRDNSCDCPAGWTGEVCANVCPTGKWGENCRGNCPVCYNNGTCDSVTGLCTCQAGFQGRQCQMQCMTGFYGANCEHVCKCENDGECDFDTGKCVCPRGFGGEFCEERACPAGRFDPSSACVKKCTCGNATLCHPVSGACTCAAGWRQKHGDACCTCCILNGEDTTCLHQCKCTDKKFICDPDLDGCVCLPWYKGTSDECSALISLSGKTPPADEIRSGGSSFGGVIIAVIAAVILVLLGAIGFVYTRRRRLRAAKYADADFSVVYSQGSQFNLHENPRLDRSISGASGPPTTTGRSDSIIDTPGYSVSGSVIAEAPAFRVNSAVSSSDGILSRASSSAMPAGTSAASASAAAAPQQVFHGVTADVPNNKRAMPRKITNIERAKLGSLAEEQYRVPLPKTTPFEASAAEAKARHLMDLQNRQGGSSAAAAAGASTSNNSLASGAYEDIDMPATSIKTYAPQSTTAQYAAAMAAAGRSAGSVADSTEHPYSTIEDSEDLMRRMSAQNSSYFVPPPAPRPAPPTSKPPALPKSNGSSSAFNESYEINPFGDDDFAKQSSAAAPVKYSMPKPLSPKRFS